MTGTSLDGLDAALVRVAGRGLDMRAEFVGMVHRPLGEMAARLRALTSGKPHAPIEYLRAARELGQLHADAVRELCEAHLPAEATLGFVTAHGQTIWHAPPKAEAPSAPWGQRPDDATPRGCSWQLLDPWPLVHDLGVPVCYDVRQADLIAGGQGAPLSPLCDWVMYRSEERHRFIVNLGGICNVTALPAGGGPETVFAEDVGPCNLLIDGLVRRLFPGQECDEDGKLSAQGEPQYLVRAIVRESPFYQRPSPRSTGREDFSDEFIDELLERAKHEMSNPYDIIASAVNAVMWGLSDYCSMLTEVDISLPTDIIYAGGGARNRTLTDALAVDFEQYGHRVMASDRLGIPCEAREAVAFAVLGALCQDGVSISLPQVTGAKQALVAGTWAGGRP